MVVRRLTDPYNNYDTRSTSSTISVEYDDIVYLLYHVILTCCNPLYLFKIRSYSSLHHIQYLNQHFEIHSVTFCPNIIFQLPSGCISYFHVAVHYNPFCSKLPRSDSASPIIFHIKTFMLQYIQFFSVPI